MITGKRLVDTGQAKADHAKADKSVNVKSLDARLKIIEAMLGLNE